MMTGRQQKQSVRFLFPLAGRAGQQRVIPLLVRKRVFRVAAARAARPLPYFFKAASVLSLAPASRSMCLSQVYCYARSLKADPTNPALARGIY